VAWHFADDVAAYARHATDLLAGDPARNTVALTVLEAVRAGRRWSPEPVLFGWSESGGHVSGAVCMTPPYELLLAAVEVSDVVPLVDALLAQDVTIPGVNGETSVATAFSAAWSRRRGVRSVISRHERLYRLGVLVPPTGVVGRARVAVTADTAVAVDWSTRFQVEAGARPVDVGPAVDDRIDDGRLWLWEDDDGRVVSMAGRAPTAVGVARVGPVYTPVGSAAADTAPPSPLPVRPTRSARARKQWCCSPTWPTRRPTPSTSESATAPSPTTSSWPFRQTDRAIAASSWSAHYSTNRQRLASAGYFG